MDEILTRGYVTYEDFGALGDGEHNDIFAIRDAHAFANAHNLPVITRPDGEYFIGRDAVTAIIETDTDWNKSHFTIDDRDVEDNKAPCFLVRSALKPVELHIEKLQRDQKKLEVYPEKDCYVIVYNADVKHFIRFGLNQNAGTDQTDCFILRRDGSIDTPIDWDYDHITKVEAYPMDDHVLTLKGGTFTTFANRGESKYDYYGRNIEISRSNTVVDGTVHYVAGEISHGSPYRGFLSAVGCANVTYQNCFSTGHKIYVTIGAAGKPVSMGSYDLHANSVINFTMRNCRINNITDNTRWGIVASNFCKNILVEDCIFSRLDAHQGVAGTYTIKNSQMGHMGVNAIGRGLLTLENVTTYGHSVIQLRSDYGSTWEGDVVLKNVRWIPQCGSKIVPHVFNMLNNGMHNFGYPCFMPQNITIDGLEIADDNVPDDYTGPFLFSDPDDRSGTEQLAINEPRPFPYIAAKTVVCKNVTTHSGKALQLCENEAPFAGIKVTK